MTQLTLKDLQHLHHYAIDDHARRAEYEREFNRRMTLAETCIRNGLDKDWPRAAVIAYVAAVVNCDATTARDIYVRVMPSPLSV